MTADTDKPDEQQIAEETGHKPRKEKQVDFDRQPVTEHEEEEPERWELHPSNSKLHREVVRVRNAINDFDFIDTADIQCVTTNKDKKGKAKKDWHVFAEIMKPKPIFQAVAQAQNATLGPFIILFRPAHFKNQEKKQEATIIHELYHLRLNENSGKVSLRPHWGFGDTEIETLQRKYLS